MTVNDLISGMLREEGGFQKALRDSLEELDIPVNEFCRITGISQSTMYKILEEQREPNLRTVRQIIKALNRMSSKNSERFIAIIASSRFMEGLPKSIESDLYGTVNIREYPVSCDLLVFGCWRCHIIENTVNHFYSCSLRKRFPHREDHFHQGVHRFPDGQRDQTRRGNQGRPLITR